MYDLYTVDDNVKFNELKNLFSWWIENRDNKFKTQYYIQQ